MLIIQNHCSSGDTWTHHVPSPLTEAGHTEHLVIITDTHCLLVVQYLSVQKQHRSVNSLFSLLERTKCDFFILLFMWTLCNVWQRRLLFLKDLAWLLILCRKMVAKSLIAGLAVLLVAAVSLLLGVFMGLGTKNTPPPLDHFYSKAAVAADAGKCSEVGR